MPVKTARRTGVPGVHEYRGYVIKRVVGGYRAIDTAFPEHPFAEVIADADGFAAIKEAVDTFIEEKMRTLAEEANTLEEAVRAMRDGGLEADHPIVVEIRDRRYRLITKWDNMDKRTCL